MATKTRVRKTRPGVSLKLPRVRKTLGGVSPIPWAPAVRGVETLVKPRGKVPPTAAAFPGFVYNGGPVIASPQVYTSFWGPLWSQDQTYQARADRLNQFHADLLQSPFMNVLSQYGVGAGAGAAGVFVQGTFVSSVPSTLTDTGIQGIIQSAVTAGALPEPTSPSNPALVIYLDETTGVNDPGNGLVLCEAANDTAFGYHNFFTTAAGNPFYYAVVPVLNDNCLGESCPNDDAGCSLHLSEPQDDRLTQVASHEFAEMTTDPQLNAWVDPTNGENGDICNGESATLTVGTNTWTVQRIYSKYDDINSNGSVYCLSQAPSPEPRLSPGPTARPAPLAGPQGTTPLERLLPLPAIHFDADTREVAVDEPAVHRYFGSLFAPFHHKHLTGNFPAMLRRAADLLVKAP